MILVFGFHFGKSDAFSEKAGFAHMKDILHIKSKYTHMKTPRKGISKV